MATDSDHSMYASQNFFSGHFLHFLRQPLASVDFLHFPKIVANYSVLLRSGENGPKKNLWSIHRRVVAVYGHFLHCLFAWPTSTTIFSNDESGPDVVDMKWIFDPKKKSSLFKALDRMLTHIFMFRIFSPGTNIYFLVSTPGLLGRPYPSMILANKIVSRNHLYPTLICRKSLLNPYERYPHTGSIMIFYK